MKVVQELYYQSTEKRLTTKVLEDTLRDAEKVVRHVHATLSTLPDAPAPAPVAVDADVRGKVKQVGEKMESLIHDARHCRLSYQRGLEELQHCKMLLTSIHESTIGIAPQVLREVVVVEAGEWMLETYDKKTGQLLHARMMSPLEKMQALESGRVVMKRGQVREYKYVDDPTHIITETRTAPVGEEELKKMRDDFIYFVKQVFGVHIPPHCIAHYHLCRDAGKKTLTDTIGELQYERERARVRQREEKIAEIMERISYISCISIDPHARHTAKEAYLTWLGLAR